MTRMLGRMGSVLLLAGLLGCATGNAISGDGSKRALVFQGPVSIAGQYIEVTIQRGSDVPKLSLLGDSLRVVIEEGAAVRKVEVAGDDNEVVCPDGMTFEYTELGDDNRLKHP